jgi:hypothetical protein
MTSLNAQGRRTIVYLTNKSGGSVAVGDVVIIDSANDNAFTTSTAGAELVGIGVVIETGGIANNAVGRVAVEGQVSLVNVNASVTRGHFGKTHTVAKQATDAGASRVLGVFCQFTTGGTTPEAILFGMSDGTTGAGGLAGGTPALTLSTTNSGGAAGTGVRTDATIAAFDATVPVTQNFGDAAATGSAGVAARRDHKHGMHGGAWTDYTPTWSSDASAPTLGNATLTGRYKSLDANTYAIRVHFVYGSTSSPGTGAWSFTLPAGLTTIATTQVIAGILLDTGTRYYLGNGWLGPSGTKIDYVVHSESGTAGRAGAGAPQTWATGDEINMDGIIEVA